MSNIDATLETIAAGSDVGAALDAARPNVDLLVDRDDLLVSVTRNDTFTTAHDMEKWGGSPTRHRGTRKALTAEGFIALADELGTATTRVYADIDGLNLVAVLNDDASVLPGWRDHRVTFAPTATPEWTHWISNVGLHKQDKFAQIIEDGETEIRTPTATVMLDLAETFNASTQAKFKQAGRRRDGRVQFAYEEDIEATAGDGLVEIPPTFTVELRPFYGATPVLVECKLRYRLERGDLSIGYAIHRPEEIQRQAFLTDVVARVLDAVSVPVIDAIPADAPKAR